MFESINGLPLHPLVVHGAVVIVPLTCLATVLIAVKRSWRKSLGWWVVALAAVGAVLAFVAKESGEALAKIVGNPAEHAQLGDSFPIVASVLFVASAALVVADRALDSQAQGKQPTAVSVLAILAIVVSAGAAVQTFRVGDSGAKAVWGSTLSNATGSKTSPATDQQTYTLAQVKAHNKPGDCWTTINGNVYNLTAWEAEHPGGASSIVALCGTDGTESFTNQHGGQTQPKEALARFQIGTLAS